MHRPGVRRKRARRVSGAVVLGVVAAVAVACAPVAPPAPPAPPPTRGSTFPAGIVPTTLTAVPVPPGAVGGGTSEWYRAPAPGGRAVVFGVYRPATPTAVPPVAALVLHGNDGFRRQYETLAARFAAAGMIGIVGCWFDRPEQPISDAPDAISCSSGPTFKGGAQGVPDLSALVAAVDQVSDVDAARLVVVGHSYGATVALDRAATGAPQPVVSSAGLLARTPAGAASPAPGDQLPADPPRPSQIVVPVLLAHGAADTIVPIGQAYSLASLLTAAGNPPATAYYPSPAGHSFPFVAPYGAQFVARVVAWVATLTFPAAATAAADTAVPAVAASPLSTTTSSPAAPAG